MDTHVVDSGNVPRGTSDDGKDLPVFTAQEESFLRAYSDALGRLDAMAQAGYIPSTTLLSDHTTIMSKAGEILGRAEQMTLAQVAFAIGGDKVAFVSVLWKLCRDQNAHAAIKALTLFARIHGLFDKADTKAPQVALVFAAARQPASSVKPVGLPFTMPGGSYEIFSQPSEVDNENGKATE